MPNELQADRVKAMLFRIIHAAYPNMIFLGMFPAKVNSRSDDGLFLDITPDDKRLPPMSKIPLRLGAAGMNVKVKLSALFPARVLVGFEDSDPSKPYCLLWDGGEKVDSASWSADKLYLGDTAGTQPTALGNNLEQRLQTIEAAINTILAHTHTVSGGVAIVSTNIGTPITSPPNIKASNVEVK